MNKKTTNPPSKTVSAHKNAQQSHFDSKFKCLFTTVYIQNKEKWSKYKERERKMVTSLPELHKNERKRDRRERCSVHSFNEKLQNRQCSHTTAFHVNSFAQTDKFCSTNTWLETKQTCFGTMMQNWPKLLALNNLPLHILRQTSRLMTMEKLRVLNAGLNVALIQNTSNSVNFAGVRPFKNQNKEQEDFQFWKINQLPKYKNRIKQGLWHYLTGTSIYKSFCQLAHCLSLPHPPKGHQPLLSIALSNNNLPVSVGSLDCSRSASSSQEVHRRLTDAWLFWSCVMNLCTTDLSQKRAWFHFLLTYERTYFFLPVNDRQKRNKNVHFGWREVILSMLHNIQLHIYVKKTKLQNIHLAETKSMNSSGNHNN